MATNTGSGGRRGAVTDRLQWQDDDGRWIKGDPQGRAIAVKQSPGAWKGVRKAPESRS